MILTGKQIENFREALMRAYPNPDVLKQMLRFQLDKRLNELVGNGGLQRIVFDLIEIAEAEGWLDKLLIAARNQNQGNLQLKEFSEQISIALFKEQKSDLQAKIKAYDEFFDIDAWVNDLLSLEKQICRIDFGLNANGTGFLVAPDLVLTNYHVVEKVIEGSYNSQNLVIRFDYKKIGGFEQQGETYSLAKDWLVAHSPYSLADIDKQGGLPAENELDYALLRLAQPLNRGFVKLPDNEPIYQDKMPLFILQHPEGLPLKLALDTMMELNENRTRLFYTTYTEGGSSGSPCFNAKWELVALHHKGDKGIKNTGIPIMRIKEDLQGKNIFFSKEGANPATIEVNNQTTNMEKGNEVKTMDKATLIKLLTKAFNDEDLDIFCMSNFDEVYNNFGSGFSKTQKIMKLISHCEQRLQMDKLSALIKEERPEMYAEFLKQ